MATTSRSNRLISRSNVSRLQTIIFNSQRVNHTVVGDVEKSELIEEVVSHYPRSSSTYNRDVGVDMSSWKVVDSRIHGLDRNKISVSSKVALSILREKGKKAYLVGGCVRDLLLGRIPKDFDVITNAELTKITKYYHRARVVGQRFPICQVFIKGSMVEVSSFETVAKDADEKETIFVQGESGCNEEHFVRWRNSLHRDFTINSLFYDPSDNKIYDYANGLRDLKLGKVQTVIPAHVSFKEDCARILRGLRIAARLGFSFSEETATAIQDLYLSILDLNKDRLMLEMDYMFSYGAAASSLWLLKRFNILPVVLPFHAAYLYKQGSDQTARCSPMLFKLFSSMDNLLACDRPGAPSLWIGVLAFHWALVENPQDGLVIWALSSVLYHGKWTKAVKFAREKSNMDVGFSPEIAKPCHPKSDKALAENVKHFVSKVTSAINYFSGLGYISENRGRAVGKLFKAVVDNLESYHEKRESLVIDYTSLKKGNCNETRFVLGKIIMDTMSGSSEPSSHLKEVEHQRHSRVGEEQDDLRKFNSKKYEVVKEGELSSLFVEQKDKHDVEEEEVVKKGKRRVMSSFFGPPQESAKGKKMGEGRGCPKKAAGDQGETKSQRLSNLFK